MDNLRSYAKGTSLTSRAPWGIFVRARALCPDGKVRACKPAITADSFFSIPARVSYKGKTVSGFITFTCDSGLTTGPEEHIVFIPRGKNASLFPVTA